MRITAKSLLPILLLCAALTLSGCEEPTVGPAGDGVGTGSAESTETGGTDRTEPAESGGASTEAAANQERHSVSFFSMDTFMELSVYGDPSLPAAARDIITDIAALASATSPSSDIYRLNHRETTTIDGGTAELLSTALDLCALTDGAFDISIYPVVRAWGFTTGENRIPTEAELSALLENVDYRNISLDGNTVSLPTGMEIDLGGVAKGYAGAKAAEYLRQQGVTSAMLSLGGNVQTVGAKPDGSFWRVAVQDPASDGFAGVLEIIDKAAVTSGGYQRFFVGEDGETYWHIMDPATGRPAKNGLVSVTIVAEDGALCDALSTALFVMGPERAVSFWRDHGSAFGMVLITEDGRLLVTPDLSFTADPSAPYRVEVLEG